MKYTAEQLGAMTDYELNQGLTLYAAGGDWLEYADFTDCGVNGAFYTLHNIVGDPYHLDVVDYCSNAGVTMPLAFAHGISIIKVRNGYVACKYDVYIDIGGFDDIDGICADGIQCGHANPLRATVCCLILVLQESAT